jgi:hypothetical protein
MSDRPRRRHHLVTGLVFAVLVAACSSGSAPLPGSAGPSPSANAGGAGRGSTGSAPPHSTIGSVPGDLGNVVDPGQPTLVLPRPGQLNVHPVAIEKLSAQLDGRRVAVSASWWSGVEPCYVLDSTAVKIDGGTITVSVRESAGRRDAACIEIAMHKVTVIDLGELDPGTYTIVADQGDAPPIDVTVNG